MDRNWQLSKGSSSPDNCCKGSAQNNVFVSSGIETQELVKACFSKNGWESGLKIHFFLVSNHEPLFFLLSVFRAMIN